MNKVLLLGCLMLTAGFSVAQKPVEVKVWPKGAPESNGLSETKRADGSVDNSSEAVLYIYSPQKVKNSGQAVVICPGGGYSAQAIKHEGHEVAAWLASEGITGIVLKYRLPNNHPEIPLKDAQEAMRIVRRMAPELALDTARIGIAGFSAGGHLASTLGTHTSEAIARPNFMLLFYPVITADKKYIHQGSFDMLLAKDHTTQQESSFSNELRVTPATPPALLLHSDDDKGVPSMNSILFYEALKRNNVKASMYIFPVGGHGWGYNKIFRYHENWKTLVLEWLKQF